MAKAAAIVSALCILAVATVCQAKPETFDVEGSVYCDPCRVGFWTNLSENIKDATVKLECRNLENGTVTYSVEGKTDGDGKYTVKVEGDHETDICEVIAVTSPKDDCNSILDSGLDRARIVCSDNTGIHTPKRYANALPFVTKERAPACKEALEAIGFNEDGTELVD